jgi:hypothetical protein
MGTHKTKPIRGAASVVPEFSIFYIFSDRIYSKLLPSCIKHEVLDISSVMRMKNLPDAGIDNVFFWINPVGKCIRYFPRCYVNRGKVTS